MPIKNNNNVNIIKVPIKIKPINNTQVFPRMPRLYLELLENKSKIKQELVNKEYIPTEPETTNSQETHNNSLFDKKNEKNFEKSLDKRIENILSDDSDSDEDLDNTKSDKQNLSPASSFSELSIEENKQIKSKENEVIDYKDEEKESSASSDDLSVRLKELLDDNSSVGSLSHSRSIKQNKYSRHRDLSGHSVVNPSAHGDAPTLAELERKGGYVPKREYIDLNQNNYSEHQEEDLKRELLFKFDLLKKSYPQATVPDFSIHTDLNTLQQSYDDTVRRLSLDSSVESYKTYLIYGFMGAEFVFGNFLGFDMQGFTQQQIVSMNSYEKLLIELGEKSYVPSGSKWPVELRLLFMIIMNAAFFVISKMIMKKTGANLMGMINNMSSNNNPNTAPSNPNTIPKKRKMKGPNIDLGDIPDLDS
jgi:hypothetical protein